MLCHVCDDPASHVCSHAECRLESCARCALECDGCEALTCMECSDECDICSAIVCPACTFVVDTCKCCQQKVPPMSTPSICIDCVMRDWFGKTGFRCNACMTLCGDMCKFRHVLEAQTECPICLEPFEDKPHRMQMCDIHKVCAACNYDEMRGCPLCRVGK